MSALELKIPPAVQVVIAAGLMWLLARFTPDLTPGSGSSILLYLMPVILGIVLVVAGGLNFRKAHTTVNPTRPENTSALVISGVYRFTRNPMYLGFLLLLVGWSMFLANAFSLLIIPALIAFMNRFQIVPEERALETRFGLEYKAYRQRVRRWI